MGVVTYEYDFTSKVSPVRYFKALIHEFQKLFPLAAPQVIKSIEVEGDIGPGTIVKINFVEGLSFEYVKDEIEEVDEDNLSYSYSLTEGGPIGDKIEKIEFKNRFVEADNGGSIRSTVMKYHTIGDGVDIEDEHFKLVTTATEKVYMAIENYLMANPDVCN